MTDELDARLQWGVGLTNIHPDPAYWVFRELDLDQAAKLEIARSSVALAKATLEAQAQHLESISKLLDRLG